jgi:hypothetical protein
MVYASLFQRPTGGLLEMITQNGDGVNVKAAQAEVADAKEVVFRRFEFAPMHPSTPKGQVQAQGAIVM